MKFPFYGHRRDTGMWSPRRYAPAIRTSMPYRHSLTPCSGIRHVDVTSAPMHTIAMIAIKMAAALKTNPYANLATAIAAPSVAPESMVRRNLIATASPVEVRPSKRRDAVRVFVVVLRTSSSMIWRPCFRYSTQGRSRPSVEEAWIPCRTKFDLRDGSSPLADIAAVMLSLCGAIVSGPDSNVRLASAFCGSSAVMPIATARDILCP